MDERPPEAQVGRPVFRPVIGRPRGLVDCRFRMRYFSRVQHDAATSDDDAVRAAAEEQFLQGSRLYEAQLLKLKPRLKKSAWKFFERVSLHDATVLAMHVGDDIHKRFQGYRKKVVNKRRVLAQIEALNYAEDRLYTLRYSRIRRLTFDYPSSEPWHVMSADAADNPIDEWMADELTAADADFLRHEVLFSSGTTILIEFQEVSVRSTVIRGRKDLPY